MIEFVIGPLHLIIFCTLHIFIINYLLSILFLIYVEWWFGSFAKDKNQRFQFHLSVPHAFKQNIKIDIYTDRLSNEYKIFLTTYTVICFSTPYSWFCIFFQSNQNDRKDIDVDIWFEVRRWMEDENDAIQCNAYVAKVSCVIEYCNYIDSYAWNMGDGRWVT